MATNQVIRVIIDPTRAATGSKKVRAELTGIQTTAAKLQTFLRRVFAFTFVGLGINQLRKFSDQFLEVQNRLRITGVETQNLAAATKQLVDVSVQTRTPLEANARLLGRIGIAAQDLGASQKQLFRFVELAGKGLAIQGASAQEARSALTQLAQALGSGIVRAEEFNSVSEGAITILQGVAQSMGITVSQLRVLVTQGKVTSKEFFEALLESGKKLDDLFKNVAPTIGQSFTVLETQLVALTGTLEQQFGALSTVAHGLLLVANNLNVLIPLAIDLGIALAGIKFALFLQNLASAVSGATTFAGALKRLIVLLPGASALVRGFGLALAFVAANPLLVSAAVIGVAIAGILQFGDAIKITTDGSLSLADALHAVLGLIVPLITDFNNLIAVTAGVIAAFSTLQILGIETALGRVSIAVLGLTVRLTALGVAFLLSNPIGQFILLLGAIAGGVYLVVQRFQEWRKSIEEIFSPAKVVFDIIQKGIDLVAKGIQNLIGFFKSLFSQFLDFVAQAKATEELEKNFNAAASAGTALAGAADKAKDSIDGVIRSGSQIAPVIADGAAKAAQDMSALAAAGDNSASALQRAVSSARNISTVSFPSSSSSSSSGGGGGQRFTSTVDFSREQKAARFEAQAQFRSLLRAVTGLKTPTINNLPQEVLDKINDPGVASFSTGSFTARTEAFVKRYSQLTQILKEYQTQQEAAVRAQQQLAARVREAINSTEEQLFLQTAKKQGANSLSDISPGARKIIAQIGQLSGALVKTNNLTSRVNIGIRIDQLKKSLDDLNDSTTQQVKLLQGGNIFKQFRQNVFAPGFAGGGDLLIRGGASGSDSKLLNLAVASGEDVRIRTASQRRREENDSEGRSIVQNISFNVHTPDADSFRRSETQIIGDLLVELEHVRARM